jgi:hypothetical protein
MIIFPFSNISNEKITMRLMGREIRYGISVAYAKYQSFMSVEVSEKS